MIVCGVDIGSLSTKAVLMEKGRPLAWRIVPTGPDSVESAQRAVAAVLAEAGLTRADIGYTVATGYGRANLPFADKAITEISCHAAGSHWSFPEVRTILDMGGQDCKAIRCDGNGRVKNFLMNDKCAAGTGRYLERVADSLGLALEDIGPLSLQERGEVLTVGSNCVVFAEGDIIRLQRQGKRPLDILAGATDAIVERIVELLERVGVEPQLCISGGVAKNLGVVRRVEHKLGLEAHIAPEPQIVGALGAALLAPV
ncbi:MAG: acyl-CoA dehydratase activase [Desulfarculaceae bacterium]|nr:acyl-CoA dehydratase activase [Desulfarculaceae bacterium]MCF8071197.1 acyl-CoA dehydratase activase [Desulfarculaceae bacterium]MCF8101200.1 acyl-CoA dehydratase activase [Desulfarculaceae bacterium]MCF8115251.1 acyl-CoA dehydratase activase [Desulfarculaceae bacterium]